MNARPWLIGALAALAACQTVPRAELAPSADARAVLAGVSAWRARGRVAVHSTGEGFSASFDWREAGGRSDIDVRGPLGAGAALITRTPQLIRIETGSNPPIDIPAPFESVEAELTTRLGFPLPIGPLRYWMLGVPDPGLPSSAAPEGFAQAGWNVALAAFAPVIKAPVALPTRLVLTRSGTQVRVVISAWQVGPP